MDIWSVETAFSFDLGAIADLKNRLPILQKDSKTATNATSRDVPHAEYSYLAVFLDNPTPSTNTIVLLGVKFSRGLRLTGSPVGMKDEI